jgi:hypothetical protein
MPSSALLEGRPVLFSFVIGPAECKGCPETAM